MGLYAINCPSCGVAYQWFSGNMDQRCGRCKDAIEWEIQIAEAHELPPELRIAQRRYPGQVDASPHWIPVIEKSAYDALVQSHVNLQNLWVQQNRELKEVQSQLLTEKAEVFRLLAVSKRRMKG